MPTLSAKNEAKILHLRHRKWQKIPFISYMTDDIYHNKVEIGFIVLDKVQETVVFITVVYSTQNRFLKIVSLLLGMGTKTCFVNLHWLTNGFF